MTRVGINGFGRIGRLSFRIGLTRLKNQIEFAAINTSGSMPVSGWAHLTNYDTTYRQFEKEIGFEEVNDPKKVTDEDPLIGFLKYDDKKVPVLAQRDPAKIPWSKYQAEVIIESTGVFTTEEEAKKHAVGGAKRVIISAPAKGGNVQTVVIGVNEPNGSHKDMRRARAAAENIVPTTTGAAIATTETIPELKGIFDGRALRVPVATGSITDFTFVLKREVTVEEVNNVFEKAAAQNALYKGILAVSREPLVSSDIIGRSESAIVDLGLTQVVDGNLVKVFAWYDNEWGYANRLVEQVVRVGKTLSSPTAPTDPITLSFGENSR
jgi:glyceraldehyde 3-phosphate dehydrogenase